MIRFVSVVAMVLALGACEKKSGPAAAPAPAPPSVSADGTRTIPINVNDEGYDPSKISAKAGEKLELEFTRRSKGACAEQVKVAGGPVIDLPLDKPVKIAVTAPASGEVRFACGMDMMTGVIVVN
jgi:plastocyanin domain-containing protein